jgi:hypothetical protein
VLSGLPSADILHDAKEIRLFPIPLNTDAPTTLACQQDDQEKEFLMILLLAKVQDFSCAPFVMGAFK